MNGEGYGFFQGKRSLRKGYPISPLLFVLAISIFLGCWVECVNFLTLGFTLGTKNYSSLIKTLLMTWWYSSKGQSDQWEESWRLLSVFLKQLVWLTTKTSRTYLLLVYLRILRANCWLLLASVVVSVSTQKLRSRKFKNSNKIEKDETSRMKSSHKYTQIRKFISIRASKTKSKS